MRQKSRHERVVDLRQARALPAINDDVSRERPQETGRSLVFLVGGGKRRVESLSDDGSVRMFSRAAERAELRGPWLTPVVDATLAATHARHPHVGGGMGGTDLMK